MANVKILRASAGSGKTYQLAYAYVRSIVRDPMCYRNILAVTFTNKATEEMKRRIVEEIDRLASGSKSDYLKDLCHDLELSEPEVRRRATLARTYILHDYSRFSVLTIDKFFQRIIRAFLRELGIDINFNLELQTESLLDGAADRLIDRIATDDRLRKWLVRFAEEKIEDDGKWDIRSEIVTLGGELFRERYKSIVSSNPDAETFINAVRTIIKQSAAIREQMRKIALDALTTIRSAGFEPSDFAYGNQGCTSYFVKVNNGEIAPYGKRVSDALENEDKWVSAKSKNKEELRALVPHLRDLLIRLCHLYDKQIRFLNSAELVRSNYRGFALLHDLAECVSELCREQHVVPISESGSIIEKLIEGNDTPFIYEKAGNMFDRFMIDEFQDTSLQQWNNFKPLLENAVAQQEDMPVLLVGDIKQSIYRWRGGDWRILGRYVEEGFGTVDFRSLDTNYRSTERVVEFNNHMIEWCVSEDNRILNELLQEASDAGFLSKKDRDASMDMLRQAYEGHMQQSHAAAGSGYVRVVSYDQSMHTAKPYVIEVIEELQQRGYMPGDIAVLVRTNAEGVAVAQQLLDYKSEHSDAPYVYDVVTQEALQIGSSPVIGFIVAVFRLVLDSEDTVSRAVYNRFLGKLFEEMFSSGEVDFFHELRTDSIEEAFEKVVMHYNLSEHTGEIAYLQAFEDQIHRFATSRVADLSLFVSWWEESGAAQSIALPQTRNAINVITVHKSKGLQYKAVIIPYCNWSLEPRKGSLIWSKSDTEPFSHLGDLPLRWNKKLLSGSYFARDYFQELILSHIDNVNLLYVAVTRAVDELYLMQSQVNRTNHVGELVYQAIRKNMQQDTVMVGTLEGTIEQINNDVIYHFGQPMYPNDTESTQIHYVTEYPIMPYDKKLSFSFETDRYFDIEKQLTEETTENADLVAISSEKEEAYNQVSGLRSYGILMHKLFEYVSDREEAMKRLEQMCLEGVISESEKVHIQRRIDKALQDPIIASWFDPKWTEVRNEHAILLPGGGETRRPDRVLIKGSEAVVIDYKFGRKEQTKYVRQLQEYIRLLKQMGYRKIQGYLWYVELERVISVSLD